MFNKGKTSQHAREISVKELSRDLGITLQGLQPGADVNEHPWQLRALSPCAAGNELAIPTAVLSGQAAQGS